MKNKFHRILALCLALTLCIIPIFAFSSSASATEYDARLYITELFDYDGGIVMYYEFPSTDIYVRIDDLTDSSYSFRGQGSNRYDYTFIPGHRYRISFFPFGYPYSYANGILCSTFTGNASIYCTYGYTYIDGEDTGYATIPTPSGYLYFAEKDAGTYITREPLPYVEQNGKTQVSTGTFQYSAPDNAYLWSFEFVWTNISWESDPVPNGFYVDKLWMRVNIPDTELTNGDWWNWTNGLISDINKYLQNDFPTYTPPEKPAMDAINKSEQDLIDFIDGDADQYDELLDGFSEVIREVGPGLLVFTWFFNMFASISFFDRLLNVVISLGITAFVLNLVLAVVTRSRTENNKSSESKDKGGGK